MPPKPTKPAAKPPTTTKGPKKAAPKPPLSPAEKLKRLFTSLCAQIDGGHFSNAIKTCDKILALSPGDEDALQTKLFLLLQTESYTAALSLIPQDSQDYAFEKAYALYRTHHEPESLKILSFLPQSRGKSHLEAQLYYRQGQYQEAFDLYNDLLESSDPGSEEHSDILTNLHASQVHLDFITSSYTRGLLPTVPSEPPALPSALPQQVVVQEKPKKKVKLPKGVVLGVTPLPDPERWLKKSERSTVAHGKRRKGGGGGGATQGASVVDEKPVASSGGGGGGKGKGRKKK